MSNSQVIVLSINNSNAVVNSGNNQLVYTLPSNFIADDYECALGSLYIFNSNFNINQALFNNTVFQYTFPTSSGQTTYTVTMPAGFYSVDNLSLYLQSQMQSNGNYLIDNTGTAIYYLTLNSNDVYYSVTLSATVFPNSLPSGWSTPSNFTGFPVTAQTPQLIVLSTNNFGTLIGYSAGSYPSTPQTSFYSTNGTLTPTLNPQYVFNLNFDAVNNPLISTFPKSIYQFSFATTSFGAQLVVQPAYPFWYSIMNASYNRFVFSITAQDNTPALLLDPSIQITLLLRKKSRLLL